MKLTEKKKEVILSIVNNPQLTFEETKQKLTTILPSANQLQIEALTKIICKQINQSKRGQFSGITELEGKKFNLH